MNLEECLRRLHLIGSWIEAWYPLSNGLFECRVAPQGTWAVHPHALSALVEALRKAEL